MKVYTPGSVPESVLETLSSEGRKQVSRCHAAVTDSGVLFYVVNDDHIVIVLITGSATRAVMALRKYHRLNLPIFFLGHTPHVISWGKKHCEEVGTIFRYKE